jgi:hypothetical protein
MEIRTAKKPDGMTAIFLIDDPQDPKPEDSAVRAYLAEWELEPKWEQEMPVDGKPRRVMYFGECYLRGFLPHIEKIVETRGAYVPEKS